MEELKEFIEKFFKNLGAKTYFRDNILNISNVPEEFEKFYGKKSPYKFVFEKNENPETELITNGCYTIKTISKYLENSGQTTLLKIDFSIKPEEEIKKRIKFSNAKIEKLEPKKRHKFFFRFTFHTTFQYLNKKEKIINEIYIHEGEVINGNLNDYPIQEGNKGEIQIPDMKLPYFAAKEELQKRIQNENLKIIKQLNKKLEHELQRIEKHFITEEKELSENISKNEKKLKELKDDEKIKRIKVIIKNLKERNNPKSRVEDKKREIQIEKQKHTLNINNKLFNTTLIYHPIFTYDCFLKNNNTTRVLELKFDPLIEKMIELNCEDCGKEIKDIFLCSNGHITCKKCLFKCESCNKEFCKNCLQTQCEICKKNICKNCSTKCIKCGKIICKDHTKKDKISGETYCNNCLKNCERCGNLNLPENFKKSPKTKNLVCDNCYRKEMQEKTLNGIFRK